MQTCGTIVLKPRCRNRAPSTPTRTRRTARSRQHVRDRRDVLAAGEDVGERGREDIRARPRPRPTRRTTSPPRLGCSRAARAASDRAVVADRADQAGRRPEFADLGQDVEQGDRDEEDARAVGAELGRDDPQQQEVAEAVDGVADQVERAAACNLGDGLIRPGIRCRLCCRGLHRTPSSRPRRRPRPGRRSPQFTGSAGPSEHQGCASTVKMSTSRTPGSGSAPRCTAFSARSRTSSRWS